MSSISEEVARLATSLPPEKAKALADYGRWLARDRDPQHLDFERAFETLSSEWKTQTRFDSSIARIAMHPSYQKIIGMGPAVVPLILREIERQPHHWFWALQSITGESPVPEGVANLDQAAKAWLEWGRKQGYSW